MVEERHVDRADERPGRGRPRRPRASPGRSPAAARPRGRRRAAPRRQQSAAAWPGAATTKTGAHRGVTAGHVARPGSRRENGSVALSRPIRRDAPPASTTASGAGVTAGSRRSRCRLPRSKDCSAAVSCGLASRAPRPAAGAVVVGRPVDLTEDAHHGVLEVLLGQPGQRERVGRILGWASCTTISSAARRRSWRPRGRNPTRTTQYSPSAAERDRLAVADG